MYIYICINVYIHIIPAKHPNRKVLEPKVKECMVDSLTTSFRILLFFLGFFNIRPQTLLCYHPRATGNQSYRQPPLQATGPAGNQSYRQWVLQASGPSRMPSRSHRNPWELLRISWRNHYESLRPPLRSPQDPQGSLRNFLGFFWESLRNPSGILLRNPIGIPV